jgi:diaminohydroxyphosphoribosylaminopyrimidine deaminase / 5-amino-6-(5-phosphoribosylamino)uracil reductase
VLADDPQLTCRLPEYGGPQPLRVVLDRRGRISAGYRVLDDAAPTLVARHPDLRDLLDELWGREVRSVLVEGGGEVLNSFLRAGLVDRLHVHVAPVLLGGAGRPLLAGEWAGSLDAAPRYRLDEVERLGDDVLLTLRPPRDPATPGPAPTPSEV